MLSRCSKRSRSNMSPVNGIEDLPGEIITEILNHLPFKDAVSTSILSKRWRHLWKQVTTFDVEAKNIVEYLEKGFPQLTKSLHKCRLRWTSSLCYLDDWTSLMFPLPILPLPKILEALKVLDLRCDQVFAFELQYDLFFCKTLEVMKLEGKFMLRIPWKKSLCLPNLVEVELNWVEYSLETVSVLISRCPALQSLTIKRRFSKDWNLTVSSLSLKRLHIYFELNNDQRYLKPSCRKLRIDAVDAPALKHLVLHDSASNDISIQGFSSVNEVDLDLSNDESPSMIVAALETFQGAEFLKVSRNTMMALAAATRTLSVSFERLAKLSVEYDHTSQSNLVELIDRCVNLQVLEIKCTPSGAKGSPGECLPRRAPRCLSSRLKQATFKQVTRFDAIIKLILNNGFAMETCNLWFGSTTRETRDKILGRVFTNKASPTCKIFAI